MFARFAPALRYHWGGYIIESELEFPEFDPPGTDVPGGGVAAEIRVRLPEQTPETWAIDAYARRSATPRLDRQRRVCVELDAVGRFRSSENGVVECWPARGADLAAVRAMLVGPLLGAQCYQRGALALHASAVLHSGGAALFVGESGAGKSTMASAFVSSGYQVYSDDLSVLRTREGGDYCVYPTQNTVKLLGDSAELLREPGRVVCAAELGQRGRKSLLRWTRNGARRPAPVREIFVLQRRPGRVRTTLRHKPHIEAAAVLTSNAYRGYYAGLLGLESEHLLRCLALARQVDVFELEYGSNYCELPEVVQTLGARW